MDNEILKSIDERLSEIGTMLSCLDQSVAHIEQVIAPPPEVDVADPLPLALHTFVF